jgi:hypothetical protein
MGIQAELKAALSDTNTALGKVQDILLAEVQERQRLKGIKFVRLPLVTGTLTGTGHSIGGDSGEQLVTPESGYVWSVRHLVIEGLTASATTPDVVNILRGGRIVWQLNGNQFAQTWGRGEMLLNAGETFTYSGVGTIASTATIICHGMALETPGEFAGKLGA